MVSPALASYPEIGLREIGDFLTSSGWPGSAKTGPDRLKSGFGLFCPF
jgi:hypothetical protein